MLVVWIVAITVLTVLTQIGGVVPVLATLAVRLLLPRALGWRRSTAIAAVFVAAYGAATLWVVPPLAAIGGRVPLPCAGGQELSPASPVFCLLNRNYVVVDLDTLAGGLAAALAEKYPGTKTLYLDASFPFVAGFPLLPHLSHDNGRALDIALWYRAPDGEYLPGQLRSPIGYGAFEAPRPGDPLPCAEGGAITLRWDLAWLQPAFPELQLDEQRTRTALAWLFKEGGGLGVERVFVEPQLAARLDIDSPLLGFQGCRAARHDDHIHVRIADVVQ